MSPHDSAQEDDRAELSALERQMVVVIWADALSELQARIAALEAEYQRQGATDLAGQAELRGYRKMADWFQERLSAARKNLND